MTKYKKGKVALVKNETKKFGDEKTYVDWYSKHLWSINVKNIIRKPNGDIIVTYTNIKEIS